MTKTEIRKQIKTVLAAYSSQMENQSLRINQSILNSNVYKTADIIFSYMALKDEVNLNQVMIQAMQDGKQIFLPKIYSGTSNMDFFKFTDNHDLNSGSFGIWEPSGKCGIFDCTKINHKKILFLVPGRAFTKEGLRLGRGKGFYDIYLEKMKAAYMANHQDFKKPVTLAGVCFPPQIVENLPAEEHDFLMDTLFY